MAISRSRKRELIEITILIVTCVASGQAQEKRKHNNGVSRSYR